MSYTYKYPHFALTVDIVLFSEGRKSILLIQRKNPPFEGMWAFPGGFVDIDERIDDAAHRELAEETGLERVILNRLGVFDALYRDPRERTVSVAYYGFVPEDAPVKAQDDAKEARWFDLSNLPDLAFDHEKIVEIALKQLP